MKILLALIIILASLFVIDIINTNSDSEYTGMLISYSESESLNLGDLNNDGVVSSGDLFMISSRYGLSAGANNWDYRADANKDGIIGFDDLMIVAQYYGNKYKAFECDDIDGDRYGEGLDCLGKDCDETNPEIHRC